MKRIFYTYILKCSDESLYCGYAADIGERIEKHNAGKGAKYTRSRLPVALEYLECFASKSEAMKRECAIKKLTRREKVEMITDSAEKNSDFALEHWYENDYRRLRAYLCGMADEKYKAFSERITPNAEMIGVRVPKLRALAKEIAKGNAYEYISLEKGGLNEEIMLEGFVIGNMELDYSELSNQIRRFSDKINNWAVSDCTSSIKRIKNFRKEFTDDIEYFLGSENPWHIRYGILFLMWYYLDDEYIDYTLKKLSEIKNDFYYVETAQAWCLATAFAKQREKTLDAVESGGFSDDVMNKFVRKTRDSHRVSADDKALVLKFKA